MSTLLHQIVAGWWAWMGPMFWQVGLLILLVSLIDLAVRRWLWPQVRYGLWLLVLVKLLIPPTWTLPMAVVPRVAPMAEQRLGVKLLATDRGEVTAPAAIGEVSRAQGGVPGSGERQTTGPRSTAGGSSWQIALFAVWIAGICVFVGFLATRIARLRRWHREQEERESIPAWFHELMVKQAERLGLDRVPAIVFSDQAVTPAVYGLLRPTLLLPTHYAESLSEEEAEHVLLHELAHIKRGDLWVNGLCLALQVIYWFNPLFAWARRQMKHVRELCCDLTVAKLLRGRTARYRKTLLDTARELLTETVEPGMGLLGVFEEPFRLVARLRWLERDTWTRRGLMTVTAAVVVVLLAPVVLPMAPAPAPLAATESTGSSPRSAERGPQGPPHAGGEVYYVRNENRIETLLLGFRVSAEDLPMDETWVGDGVMSANERGRAIVVDRHRGRLIFVDHNQRTYTETPLPLDTDALLSEEILERHRRERWAGVVRVTRGGRRILGRRCQEYEVEMWEAGRGRTGDRGTTVVWASPDVPFDMGIFDEYLECLRKIYNRDHLLRKELRKIEGLQFRLQFDGIDLPWTKRIVSEVVEITRRVPPAGIFEPPEGYRRLERVENLDF